MILFNSYLQKGLNKAVLSLFLLVVLGACAKNITNTGYNFDEAAINKLIAEKSTKPRVTRLLGSPSATSDFGQETWYYIHRRYENVAFWHPNLKEQEIIAIRFDDNNEIVSMKKYNANNAREFALNNDATPTEGHDLGFIEQLLGNLGRFNSQRDPLN